MQLWCAITYLTSNRKPLKVVSGFLAPLVLALASPLSLSSDLKLCSRKFTWKNKKHLIRKTHNFVMWPFSGFSPKNEMCDPWHSCRESRHWIHVLALMNSFFEMLDDQNLSQITQLNIILHGKFPWWSLTVVPLGLQREHTTTISMSIKMRNQKWSTNLWLVTSDKTKQTKVTEQSQDDSYTAHNVSKLLKLRPKLFTQISRPHTSWQDRSFKMVA